VEIEPGPFLTQTMSQEHFGIEARGIAAGSRKTLNSDP
jgi:hypothetical protein